MLLRTDEYIANDVTTHYYSNYAISYPAEGTKQVKTLFINRFKQAICDCSERLTFIPSIETS